MKLAAAVAFAISLHVLGALGAPAGAAGTAVPIVPPASEGDPWTAPDIAKLTDDVNALLAGAPAVRGAHVGVLAVDAQSGTPVYARSADDAFQVASSTKLIVGSLALERLGAAFRFHTAAFVDDAGTLVLRGGGDPFLAAADLESLAAAVAGSGVRAIRRDVEVDDSAFDRVPYPAGWTVDDAPYDYAPVVSALTFEENVLHLSVAPGARRGTAALVSLGGLGAKGISGSTCDGGADVVVVPQATTAAAGSESTLDLERAAGSGCIRVVGAVAADAKPEALDAAVPNPPLYARRALLEALRARGVTVPEAAASAPGDHRYVRAKGTALRQIWSHDSPPLGDFIGARFWIPSDNLVAELLLKELGLQNAAGAPGSSEAGVALETAWLQTLGVDSAAVSLFDGSGLSRYDRLTPRALVAVLQHDWNGPARATVLGALPVGGARGTIEGIAGTDAAGRVFAKTGSFLHVRGLAGYLAPKRHGALTFAFVVDDWNGGDYRALAALRANVLARFIDD